MEDIYNAVPEAEQFRNWLLSNSAKPGTMVFTYLPDSVIPDEYHFIDHTSEPGVPAACGIRLFMKNYDGDVCNVEYFTAYPRSADDMSDDETFDPIKTNDDLPPEAWTVGWQSAINVSAQVISTMQTDYMYAQSEALGFDIEAFMEEASQYMDALTATVLATTYLRFKVTAAKVATLQDEGRNQSCEFLLGICNDMLQTIHKLAENK